MTGVAVRWLGHASVVLDLGGVRVLTDPLLRRHAGVLRRHGAAPRAEHWADPTAVLISHLHYDHAEIGSLRMLGDVPVLSAPSNARWLAGHGVGGAQGVVPDEWWPVPGSDVRIRPVTAEHGHRPMPHRPNAANGFVIAAPGVRVWFAGDTAPYPAMRDLPELAGGPIDLALIPVGGWGPRLSGGHLDPVQAAEVCAVVGARHAVPIHWGTLHAPAARRLPPGWMERGGPAFGAALARRGLSGSVLEPGELLRVEATRGQGTP
ncbi:MBL fold metallo-hydrolase [Cellulomonas sp. NPDC089187]|uniref:MBL fold metallo-hydrolase n=1 Tax=Cellulomonas sp. NPDC089187 TaxID=3154970 RepID=UPI003440D1A7